MNTLIELQQLARTNPGLTGTPDQQAAWHEARARFHERYALDPACPDAERATEEAIAASAFEHAHQLRQRSAATQDAGVPRLPGRPVVATPDAPVPATLALTGGVTR